MQGDYIFSSFLFVSRSSRFEKRVVAYESSIVCKVCISVVVVGYIQEEHFCGLDSCRFGLFPRETFRRPFIPLSLIHI